MIKNNTPGIAIFAYNRPQHLKKTLNTLSNNLNAKKFDTFIFCDGAKNNKDIKKINYVREISKTVGNFKSKKFFFRKSNYGLCNSLKYGISKVLETKKSVIVLEDDIITNKHFLNYMDEALNFYSNTKNIGSITGYSYTNTEDDLFLSQRHASWGWGTWKNTWEKMRWEKKYINNYIKTKNFKKNFNKAGRDMYQLLEQQINNKIDTMDILFNFNCFIKNKYCVCPKKSLLYNIGLDGSGIHCKKNDQIFNNYDKNYYPKKFSELELNENIIKKIHSSFEKPIIERIKNKFIKILNSKIFFLK